MPAVLSRLPMRRAASPPAVRTASRPPPVKGWNTVLPLDSMGPDWAILLDNWFPQPGYVELRGGHASHCDTTDSGNAESLMAYHGDVSADDKLFTAAGTSIYDVTTSTPSAVVTGLSNARWQHTNFTTTGGKFLYCVNGADDPEIWDGSTWSNPTITGITASEIIGVTPHKNRLWFVIANSTDAAYLTTDAIQGAASAFPLGGLFRRGGVLQAIVSWSRDAGNGPDDYLAFISSQGDIAVYAGTDPSDASKWNIIGIFEIGPPIGRRCVLRIGGDVAIISVDGVLPLSQIPGIERGASQKIALTANIQPTMNDAARDGKSLFGWQLISYPRGTMAILNVPLTTGDFQQYVMNTITGAWARFTNMNAHCWEVFQDKIYFGGDAGIVYQADTGGNDNGDPIAANSKTAFDYMNARGQQKRWVMLRPKFTVGSTLIPMVALNVDFRDDQQPAPALSTIAGQALWDTAIWDTDVWPDEQTYRNEWVTVTGVGYCASVRLQTSVQSSGSAKPILRVNGYDFMWCPGGPM